MTLSVKSRYRFKPLVHRVRWYPAGSGTTDTYYIGRGYKNFNVSGAFQKQTKPKPKLETDEQKLDTLINSGQFKTFEELKKYLADQRQYSLYKLARQNKAHYEEGIDIRNEWGADTQGEGEGEGQGQVKQESGILPPKPTDDTDVQIVDQPLDEENWSDCSYEEYEVDWAMNTIPWKEELPYFLRNDPHVCDAKPKPREESASEDSDTSEKKSIARGKVVKKRRGGAAKDQGNDVDKEDDEEEDEESEEEESDDHDKKASKRSAGTRLNKPLFKKLKTENQNFQQLEVNLQKKFDTISDIIERQMTSVKDPQLLSVLKTMDLENEGLLKEKENQDEKEKEEMTEFRNSWKRLTDSIAQMMQVIIMIPEEDLAKAKEKIGAPKPKDDEEEDEKEEEKVREAFHNKHPEIKAPLTSCPKGSDEQVVKAWRLSRVKKLMFQADITRSYASIVLQEHWKSQPKMLEKYRQIFTESESALKEFEDEMAVAKYLKSGQTRPKEILADRNIKQLLKVAEIQREGV